MQKILELKGDDFMQGLSLQTKLAIGGNLQVAANFNPFKKMGRIFPTLGPTRKDGGSIAVTIKAFDFYSDGTDKFLFGFGNSATVGTDGAYKINLATDAITNFSANVHTNTSGTQDCSMVKIWNGKVIYDQQGGGQSIRSVNPSGSSDTNILTGLTSSHSHPSVVGPDGYLYILNGQYIAQITNASGTSGNTATAFDSLQNDLIGRDIDHDGQYIVAGFDNNTNKLSGIIADCQIVFWDRDAAFAQQRWSIPEAYIIAIRTLNENTYILTPSGWYVCSIFTKPKLVYPMTSECPFNYFPTDYNGVSKDGHSIYWIDSGGTDKVFAIGQKIQGKPKIVYNPYSGKSTTENMKAIIVSGSYIYTSTDINRIYKLDSATGTSCTLSFCPKDLDGTYTHNHTKVSLLTALASGDSVTHGLYNSADEIVSDNEEQTFANKGAKKSLVFRRKATANAVVDFEDIYPTITTNAEIGSVCIYANQISNHSEQK